MALLTHAEKAALYENTITNMLIDGDVNTSYSVLDRQFTRHDLEKLERLQARHERLAIGENTAGGIRVVADIRSC